MDAALCRQKIADLEQLPAFQAAVAAAGSVEGPGAEHEKLLAQMTRFGDRLAVLSSQEATATRKRPWAGAVSLDDLPGSDMTELTRDAGEKDKNKGLRKQYAEVQHHYVAHKATGAAVEDARKALEGNLVPEIVNEALTFVLEAAEEGATRARKRAKLLAMVADKGPELGWPMAEILELKSYADDEDDDKAIRKAEKAAKADKGKAAKSPSKGNPQRPNRRNDANDRPRERDDRREDTRTCHNCGRPGHMSRDCRAPRRTGGGR